VRLRVVERTGVEVSEHSEQRDEKSCRVTWCYVIGWLVPALLSALAAAIHWNDQRSRYTL